MKYKVNITNILNYINNIVNLTKDCKHSFSKEGYYIEVDSKELSEELKKQNDNIQKLFSE